MINLTLKHLKVVQGSMRTTSDLIYLEYFPSNFLKEAVLVSRQITKITVNIKVNLVIKIQNISSNQEVVSVFRVHISDPIGISMAENLKRLSAASSVLVYNGGALDLK